MEDPRADLARAYDDNAEAREARGEPAWRDDIRADFARRLAAGARMLEIGAGVGYSARWFADQGFDVVATDLSPGNVAKIRAKGVTAEVADMGELPFDDAAFDGVWAASCLMHIPDADLPGVLGEIRRVLGRGGYFWAGTWGGIDSEGIWEDDFYRPKRFYSLRNDDRLKAFYEQQFRIVSFTAWYPETSHGIEWSYQAALLQAE